MWKEIYISRLKLRFKGARYYFRLESHQHFFFTKWLIFWKVPEVLLSIP